ncbi:MAG: anti-sigma factor [Agarilytica sp.]
MTENKQGGETRSSRSKSIYDWKALWQWGSPTIAAIALMLVLFGYYPSVTKPLPAEIDYVAILTDSADHPLLVVLGINNENHIRLKWQSPAPALKPNGGMQLWAVSRDDAKTRPIALLLDTQTDQLSLTTTQRQRLTNASFLLLTEESPEGPATNEPSDMLLAKGLSVKLSQAE